MKTYILEKSPRKNKRFRIYMTDPTPHFHDFGQKDGKTFIDGRTEKERQNWIARHKSNKTGIVFIVLYIKVDFYYGRKIH